MIPQPEEIRAEIERALNRLSERKGMDISQKIRPILYTNLDRGRIQGFVEGEIDRVHDYVWRVADNYVNLNPFIKNLQEGETSTWDSLILKLQKWAYHFLRFDMVDMSAQENARECANEAAIIILNAHFPYDTDFDPWAHVIVKNVCLKFIRKATKKSAIPQQSIIHMDDTLDTIKDSQFDLNEQNKGLQDDLFEAMVRLSNSRRRVIELKYLEDYSLDEIAQKMGKSIGAIYCLHFNALNDMRKILSKNKDNLYESEI